MIIKALWQWYSTLSTDQTTHRRMIRKTPFHVWCICIAVLLPSALRVLAAVPDPNQVVSSIVINGYMREGWPAQGVVGIRRPGSTGAITVNFKLSGTATLTSDYTASATTSVTIPDQETEVWLRFAAVKDAIKEPTETIVVTLQSGTGYTLTPIAAQKTVTLQITDYSPKPGPHEAARFLLQAAFGPDSDSSADADIIPQNVQQVMSQGFDGWINDQFLRPVGLQQPYVDYQIKSKGHVSKVNSWWNRVMGVPSLVPNGKAQAADPLRQRMAFALSEILVISDRVDALVNEHAGMANYYDLLLNRSFGNYRDLLYDVAMHPCMGIYLSHLGNKKANDPVAGTFPDENFAREVMQLFSIGLWQLNNDGTQVPDAYSQPIPTYSIKDITEFARVFTGLDYATNLAKNTDNHTVPMMMDDSHHDVDAKTLINGVQLPARTASDTGVAGLADIHAAIDCLFNHPSCPPFISKQLIQKFVTSNPSPEYVSRVTAKFINNGVGVRGDLKTVLKTILLDPEARDPTMLSDTGFGKMREPYLRTVNFARAFNSKSTTGTYYIEGLSEVLLQQPYSAPSVFNFFKPGYSPPGPVSNAGLVGPEFQVVNALTALAGPNFYYYAITDGLNSGYVDSGKEVFLQLAPELALADDVPGLMRRLDMVLTGGMLSPEQHQIIREAVEAILKQPITKYYSYKLDRVQTAIYLIVSSPEFGMIR